MTGNPTRSRRAFTLIELLVVIAIIAILAAILFPVFAQAREAARTSSCRSNCKQIMMGLMMYNQDFDETFPHCNYKDSINGLGRWRYAVYPYVKNTGVFKCPSYSQKSVSDGLRSYGTNVNIIGWASSLHLSDIAAPADTVLMGDSAQCSSKVFTDLNPQNWYLYQNSGTDWQFTPPRDGNDKATNWFTTDDGSFNHSRRLIPRHQGMVIVGYCDGHVKSQRADRLFGPLPQGASGSQDFFDRL